MKTSELVAYLKSNYPSFTKEVEEFLMNFEETVVYPTRIFKNSKSSYLVSKDPESGELAHFSQLMAVNPISSLFFASGNGTGCSVPILTHNEIQ